MNKVERPGVFETNSSSSHSITLASDDAVLDDTLPVDAEGVCYVFTGEFARDYGKFTDARTKASFCLTYLKVKGDEGYKGPDEDLLEMLKQTILTHVPTAKTVRFAKDVVPINGMWNSCYIDDRSETICEPMFKDDATLARFIFSKDSILITDYE